MENVGIQCEERGNDFTGFAEGLRGFCPLNRALIQNIEAIIRILIEKIGRRVSFLECVGLWECEKTDSSTILFSCPISLRMEFFGFIVSEILLPLVRP